MKPIGSSPASRGLLGDPWHWVTDQSDRLAAQSSDVAPIPAAIEGRMIVFVAAPFRPRKDIRPTLCGYR
jgi:hypothetical protein